MGMFRTVLRNAALVRYFAQPIRRGKMIPRLSYKHRQLRNAAKIEIDITYRCNMRCDGCNRSVPQAPTDERMSVEQISRFVAESVQRDKKWESIMLIGGEPTLHPDLGEIVALLRDYKVNHCEQAAIVLATNGAGGQARKVMKSMPPEVTFRDSNKADGYLHESFNDAPCDSLAYALADYTWGCPMSSGCGTAMTPWGYYVCPIAGGGIDRVFGFDLGRKQLPPDDDQMDEQRKAFCRLCGHFKETRAYNRNTVSRTWRRAYRDYQLHQPALTRY